MVGIRSALSQLVSQIGVGAYYKDPERGPWPQRSSLWLQGEQGHMHTDTAFNILLYFDSFFKESVFSTHAAFGQSSVVGRFREKFIRLQFVRHF